MGQEHPQGFPRAVTDPCIASFPWPFSLVGGGGRGGLRAGKGHWNEAALTLQPHHKLDRVIVISENKFGRCALPAG